jgi:hypothetical protein
MQNVEDILRIDPRLKTSDRDRTPQSPSAFELSPHSFKKMRSGTKSHGLVFFRQVLAMSPSPREQETTHGEDDSDGHCRVEQAEGFSSSYQRGECGGKVLIFRSASDDRPALSTRKTRHPDKAASAGADPHRPIASPARTLATRRNRAYEIYQGPLTVPGLVRLPVGPVRDGESFPIFFAEDACCMRVPWQKKGWRAAARSP